MPISQMSSTVTQLPALLQSTTAPWYRISDMWRLSLLKSKLVPRTPIVPVGVSIR